MSITVLDKLTYAGNPANLDPVRGSDRFAFVQGDICDAATGRQAGRRARRGRALRGRVARGSVDPRCGRVHPDERGRHPDPARRGAAPTVSRTFVHISTDEVYGSIDEGSWPETDPLQPNSPYSAAKAGSDLIALAYHRTHGLDVRVTRCSNNYGPPPVPGEGHPAVHHEPAGRRERCRSTATALNVRDWLHIDDHVQGIELVRTVAGPARSTTSAAAPS